MLLNSLTGKVKTYSNPSCMYRIFKQGVGVTIGIRTTFSISSNALSKKTRVK